MTHNVHHFDVGEAVLFTSWFVHAGAAFDKNNVRLFSFVVPAGAPAVINPTNRC